MSMRAALLSLFGICTLAILFCVFAIPPIVWVARVWAAYWGF